MNRSLDSLVRLLAGFSLALALVGCSTLPAVNREAIASEAIALSPQTTLGRIASTSMPAPELSGFRLMPLGLFSLDTRVQLARRAEVSLDVQYYHFENDETGRWLLRALRDAAERGVRVRLLIDDLYTGGQDPLWLAFAAHRNVQVRLFNPFCCARDRGQALTALAAFAMPDAASPNVLLVDSLLAGIPVQLSSDIGDAAARWATRLHHGLPMFAQTVPSFCMASAGVQRRAVTTPDIAARSGAGAVSDRPYCDTHS